MAAEGACKVDRVVEEYGLDPARADYDSVDGYLRARWTGSDGRSADGYRTLARWFNKRLLKHVYDTHGRETVGVRVDSEYDALTGDDGLAREEVLEDLRADGIDAAAVVDDMVSWSTLRHHLNDCLDAEKATTTATTDWERESVRIAQERTAEKVAEALRSLESKGDLPSADRAEVAVQVQLSCPECPVRVSLSEAVSRGYICRDHL
jgi:DNA-binding transcriptional ArsR family regulator